MAAREEPVGRRWLPTEYAARAGLAAVVPVLVVALSWAGWLRGRLTAADAVDSYLLTNSAMAVTFSAFGALVLAHRPRHCIGRLFVVFGALYTVSVSCLGIRSGLPVTPFWDRWLTVLGVSIWVPAVTVVLPLILQLFPDGTPLSPRWRPLAGVTVAFTAVAPALVLVPDALADEPLADRSPLVPRAVGEMVEALLPVLVLSYFAVLLVSVAALALRARRSTGDVRAQTLWLLWAIVVVVVANAQRFVTADGPVVFLLTMPLIPAAAAVAIVRHRLYDIRVVINRSLVYAALTVALLAVYVLVVRLAGSAAGAEVPTGPAVLASALVAVAFSPARTWLQAGVDACCTVGGGIPLRSPRGRACGSGTASMECYASSARRCACRGPTWSTAASPSPATAWPPVQPSRSTCP